MKYSTPESSTLEWKRELPTKEQIVKTIIGFCNRHGGKIVIGVANNGEVMGIDEDIIQEQMEFLDKMIYESCAPPIIPLIHAQRIGDKNVLIIEVSSGMNKPYYIRSQGLEKGTYIRLGKSTLRANMDMIEELKWSSKGRFYDHSSLYHATYGDFDLESIYHFFTISKGRKKNSINAILSSYALINEEYSKIYPTVAGMLLFGKNPEKFLPEAFILCSHFSGILGRNAIASQEIHGNLFEQFELAFAFILKSLTKSFEIKKAKREEKLEIPEIAIREALLNAIVHRNYHIAAPLKIAIYENRIEIFSPGDFPGPISQSNLLSGLTYIRNPAITKSFRKAGYIEKLGSGFTTLFTAYTNEGLKTPEIFEGENFIKCLLPRPATPFLGLPIKELDEEGRILALFNQTDKIKISDVIHLLGIPRATAGRKLQKLVKAKVIRQMGVGKTTEYEAVRPLV